MIRETFWSWGLRAAAAWARRWSPDKRYRRAGAFAVAASRLFPAQRRAVRRNLDVIQASGSRHVLVDDVFRHFGWTLLDFLTGFKPEIRIVGREKAEEARRKGRGVIFLTTHLGSWELGGKILAKWGWDVTAIYQPYQSAAMQEFIQSRRADGLSYLPVGKGAARGMSKILDRGGVVAILGDRPFGEDGEPVLLCGREARLPRGPFLFAAHHGTPIVPGFVLIEAPGRIVTVVEDPLWPVGKGPAAVKDLLDRTALILEKYLIEHAEQWYCFESAWSAPSPGVWRSW